MKKTVIPIIFAVLFVLNFSFASSAAILESQAMSIIDSELIESYASLSKNEKQSIMLTINDPDVDIRTLSADIEEARASVEPGAEPVLHNISEIRRIMSESDEYDSELMSKLVDEQRAAYKKLYSEKNTAFAEKYLKNYDVEYVCSHFPIIYINASYSEVLSLSKINGVQNISAENNTVSESVGVFPDEIESGIMSVGEDYTIARIQNANLHNSQFLDMTHISYLKNTIGLSGENVNIGMIERATPLFGSYLNVAYTEQSGSIDTSDTHHATDVAYIINSVANEANIYCIGVGNTSHDIISAIDKLLSRNVYIINSSWGTGGVSYYVAKSLDALIWREYVSLIISTGNYTNVVDGFALSYNSIGVGNVNIEGTISATSSYCMFNNANYPHKPDICAPGTEIKRLSNLQFDSGTSYSAPYVAGMIALLCEYEPDLILYPQTIKAIITSAVNISYTPSFGTTYTYTRNLPKNSDSNYKEYGSGIIDGTRSYDVVTNNQYIIFASFGSPDTTEIDSYTIQLNQGDVIRASLCYSIAQNSAGTGVESLWNVDLLLYNSNSDRVSYSATKYSNVEILEYTVEESGTYTLKVKHSSKTNCTYGIDYGLAWSFYD